VVRLYADENFPLPVFEEFRRLEYDVEICQQAGHAGQAMSDEAVLADAVRQGRAILTLNRLHFIRLPGARPEHAGVVVRSFDPDFVRQAWRINEAIASRGHMARQLSRVNRPDS
jgi:hypothetical protein